MASTLTVEQGSAWSTSRGDAAGVGKCIDPHPYNGNGVGRVILLEHCHFVWVFPFVWFPVGPRSVPSTNHDVGTMSGRTESHSRDVDA